jgi:NAD(P)-dependent dehydrogenase (short-subunit alcohol dehydrogenase family)
MSDTSLRFDNNVVVVTGASRGIGRAIAEAFAAGGARVVGTCTGAARPDDICSEWIQADFTDMTQIESCAAQVRVLEPHVLINNAGINKIAPFVEIAAEDFLRIQQVNVFAPLALAQAAIPAMKRRGWGRIVNISSIWGKISKAQRGSYSASKFAIDGLTLALAAEHSGDGILANSVAPGFVNTELTRAVLSDADRKVLAAQVPARRFAEPEEIAKLVIWLASEENTYVTGQNIAADGGFSRV